MGELQLLDGLGTDVLGHRSRPPGPDNLEPAPVPDLALFTSNTEPAPASTPQPVPAPKSYWQIKLAWSEYRQGEWQPKQITGDYLVSLRAASYEAVAQTSEIAGETIPDFVGAPDKDQYVFEAAVEKDQLVVRVFFSYQVDFPNPILQGEFRFDSSNGVVSLGYPGIFTLYPEDQPTHTIKEVVNEATLSDIGMDGLFEFEAWKEQEDPSPEQLQLLAIAENKEKVFLDATPSTFRLAYPHQYSPYAPPGALLLSGRQSILFRHAHGRSGYYYSDQKAGHNRSGVAHSDPDPRPAGPVEESPSQVAGSPVLSSGLAATVSPGAASSLGQAGALAARSCSTPWMFPSRQRAFL